MEWNIDVAMLKSMQPLLISYGSKIIAALLIFIIGKWLAWKITNVLAKVLKSRKIKITFDERGISFPYPQQDVHLFKPAE